MRAIKTSAGDSKRAYILERWASLSKTEVSWNPVAKMVRVAEVQAERLESRLNELLKSSDEALRKISLCEPLFADAGLNRWLTEEREEAYSDWLEWILGQLQLQGGAAEILAVLGIADSEIVARCQGCESRKFKIQREYYMQWGRLDLLLTIEDFMIVIEVKKYSAEISDTAKQKGYYEWLLKQHPWHPKAILLVSDAAELEYENFTPLLWENVCIRLRHLLPELHKGIGPVKAAMFVAFIGAVETNLLNLIAPEHADAVERISYARTIKHIEKYLRGSVV